jgi:DNA replication and repair protein RecF
VRLLSLGLRNYRNYARLDLEPGPQLNIFLGRNGQGKTNLLESVALLALSSSPRARRETELIGPLAGTCRVEAIVEVEAYGRRLEIEIEISSDGERSRRRIQVDGRPIRALDLPGHFRVTLFWPDDLSLIKAGPENRRRFLNQLLVQVEPGYARALSRYQRVLEQRNSLLKSVAGGEQAPATLEVWDRELAGAGEVIVRARTAAVSEMAPLAARGQARIAGGEELELEYVGPPPDLLQAVQKSLAQDLRRGVTTQGPHRDDLAIRLAGVDARSFASQGQQRSAVVSLKLAEAALICARGGEPPVLLLDDVLSELDEARRRALLESVSESGQVVITSVEQGPFPDHLMRSARLRCIDQGRVEPCG